MAVTDFFIHRSVTTTLMMAGLLGFGLISYFSLPVSDLPPVEYPTIQVTANLPGANPDTMASAVATPLEKAFSNIAGIDSMSSASITAHMFHQCLPCGFTYRNSRRYLLKCCLGNRVHRRQRSRALHR